MKLLPASILVFYVLFSCWLSAQQISPEVARFDAMAGTSVASGGCWSVYGNQAGLATIENPLVGGSFQNRFLLRELSGRAGLIVVPVQSSVFALSFFQFGDLPFRQAQLGLAYARRIIPNLNFGFQFNYYSQYFVEENKSAGATGIELGIQYSLNKQTVLGIHLRNPYRTGIKTSSEIYYYHSGIILGVLYRISNSFRATSELENDFGKQIKSRTGIEYDILKNFCLRSGVALNPVQFSAGFGFQFNKMNIDLATSYHSVLGNSPSVAIFYQF